MHEKRLNDIHFNGRRYSDTDDYYGYGHGYNNTGYIYKDFDLFWDYNPQPSQSVTNSNLPSPIKIGLDQLLNLFETYSDELSDTTLKSTSTIVKHVIEDLKSLIYQVSVLENEIDQRDFLPIRNLFDKIKMYDPESYSSKEVKILLDGMEHFNDNILYVPF